MRIRLQKKLRLGKFQELGFDIKFKFDEKLSESELDAFFDTFIDVIEENELDFGGGGHTEWDGFVAHHRDRGSVTEEQRGAVENWLKGNSLVLEYEVGPLKDCWYD